MTRERTGAPKPIESQIGFLPNATAKPKMLEASNGIGDPQRDREVFFHTLVHPPKPNARLKRAFRSARERVVS